MEKEGSHRKIFNLKETEKLSDFRLENSENESAELNEKIKRIIEKMGEKLFLDTGLKPTRIM